MILDCKQPDCISICILRVLEPSTAPKPACPQEQDCAGADGAVEPTPPPPALQRFIHSNQVFASLVRHPGWHSQCALVLALRTADAKLRRRTVEEAALDGGFVHQLSQSALFLCQVQHRH